MQIVLYLLLSQENWKKHMVSWVLLLYWSAKFMGHHPFRFPGFMMDKRLPVERSIRLLLQTIPVLWKWMDLRSLIWELTCAQLLMWLGLMNAVHFWVLEVSITKRPESEGPNLFSQIFHFFFVEYFWWLWSSKEVQMYFFSVCFTCVLRTTIFCEETWTTGCFIWGKRNLH